MKDYLINPCLLATGSETVLAVLTLIAKGFSNYFQSLVYNSTSTSTNEKIFMDVCNLFVFFFSGKTIVWPGTKMFNAGYWLELILKSSPLVPIQSNSRY